MCGIAGFFGIRANRVLLETMNDLQAHRGPDGSGLFLENLVGLAHRRLSILDIDGGAQPIESKNGRYVIIHNGEVYNYAELRLELEALGKNFSTNTDTEVIVEAYDTWGDAVFDRFNGMWAFAIYDKLEERLVISRDHFGIKPIYFAFANAEPADAQQVVGVYSVPESSDLPNATAGSTLLFASEIMPILSTGLVEKRPNDKTIYRYLRFRVHDNSRETFFSGVEKLLPGEMLVIDKSGYEIRAYTRFRDELRELAKINKPYTDAARDQYLNMLTDSIRMRLQSDVTIGTSLSGGLDSSTVAVLIARLMNQEASATTAVGPRQNVFSAIFPGSINDEERYVDAATASCGDSLTVHKILPNADEFKQDIVEFVRTQEEPLISTGPYAQYKVMQQAAQHVKVLLDGQGADETMAGYIPYYFVYLRALRRQGQYLKMVREFLASFDILFRLGRFRLFDMLKFRKQIAFTDFLNPAFIEAHKNESFTVVRDDLKERLIEDVFENSIPSLLRYEDKNTMHFGLEGRVPFLDRELVSYVFSLSDEAIIKNGWNKRILRDSLRGTLPDMIAKRRNKIGFTTPEHERFIRLKNYFYDIFLSEEFASRPYFRQSEVVAAFDSFIKGRSSAESMAFWRMINVELWLREFFDEPKPAPEIKQSDFVANHGKQLDIEANGKNYRRYPIRTEMINAETDLDSFVLDYVKSFYAQLPQQTPEHQQATQGKSALFISEKVVAITQGRSYFIWDIKTGFWANLLSRFVTRTPTGIGLGSPFTMQLAIEEAGLPRILYASIGSALGKLVGKRGLFYTLAGNNVGAIDGPTEYSVYPANVSAKLAPKDPDQVAARLSAQVRAALPSAYRDQFAGVVVIDANDIGRNVLGTDAPDDPRLYESIFADNPLGQAQEQTPIALVFEQN